MKYKSGKCSYKIRMLTSIIALCGFLVQADVGQHFFETQSLGYHPGGINYWDAPYFANALAIDSLGWIDQNNKVLWRTFPEQIDVNGYPKYLQPEQIVRAIIGQGMAPSKAPSTWPSRSVLLEGQVTLTWTGTADVRCAGTFISSKSSCIEEGPFNGGTRVYLIPVGSRPVVTMRNMDSANPVTEVKCWLPDPSDPQNKSLVNKLFHPEIIDLITSRNWGWIRMMQWGETNGNPQKNWEDRRLPTHCNQNGVINRRDPSEGTTFWTDSEGVIHRPADRPTGCSYEYMVALCNETDRNLWINIPHLATDNFVTNLAQLIQYGSDGVDPYDSVQGNPTWAPLKSGLKVFVENSNEVWMNYQWNFPQGDWSRVNAETNGITKPQFTARQLANFWAIFEGVMGTEKVVRLAAAWNSISSYTLPFLDELDALSMSPEIIAGTTYFGNGIQFWIDDNPEINLPVSDTPWTSDYWTSQEMEEDLTATYKKWKHLVLGGLKHEGNTGADEVGRRGGIGPYLNQVCVDRGIPLVSYEGGPDIYTKVKKADGSWLDSDSDFDDAITLFIEEFNRREYMQEIYYIHMNQAFERGLSANVGFTDVSSWGKNGQWGHLEYLGQPPEEAPKHQLLLKAFDTFGLLRSINNPLNAVPVFDTPADLPSAETGIFYSQTITTSGGDGVRTVELIDLVLPEGLSFNTNTLMITGVPSEAGTAYIYLRMVDEDYDPVWRSFTFPVAQRSSDPSITIDFEQQTGEQGGTVTNQPLLIADYSFSCPQSTNQLAIRSQTIGFPSDWPSVVLHVKSWGHDIAIKRIDQTPFDLFSVEVGSRHADRCVITAYHLGGGISEITVELPEITEPLTLILTELDLVSLTHVTFAFFDASIGGVHKFGAIDNLKLNQIDEGSYEAWSRAIDWGEAGNTKTNDADSDTLSNALEYAMDLDPLTSNGPPTSIATDSQSALIHYRRNRMATNVAWVLSVTDSLFNSWSNWPIDNINVFSDMIDPDIDGDQSAELMQYRIPIPTENQSLFFRIGVE